MAVSNSYPYPGFTNPYVRGKLPSVKSRLNRKMCAGRIFIFLILGVLLTVLGLVSMGVYFNVNGSTSSSQYTEIMPLYITSGTVILAGLCVSILFWRRLKLFVFVSVVVCVATGFLCGITAVLTCTHVLQPLQTFRSCRYYTSQRLCQCFSPYRRDILSLEYSETEYTKYDFEDVTSCETVQYTLPRLLYVLVAVYGLVFLLCVGSAILALLVLRAERIKQRFLGDESYEEVYTVSGSSSQDQSDSEPEVATEVTTSQLGQSTVVKSSIPIAKNSLPSQTISRDSSSVSVSQSVSSVTGNNRLGPTTSPSLTSQSNVVNSGQPNPVQRSKTPGLNDLAKETLANRYKINKTPDRDLNVRQRLSKTPDREIGSSRRHSFVASKRLSKSCDSLDSSGNSGRDINGNCGLDFIESKKKGKLKEHRRKGKRAATVHTLDTDQLMLILNLQMRYLQETREQQAINSNTIQPGSRRAITPQPVSQRQVIPQKVRSHTPQPRRANQRTRDQVNYNTYPHDYDWNLQGAANTTNSENSSRRTSESSDRNFEITTRQSNPKFVYTNGHTVGGSENYLLGQQLHRTAPHIREGHNPYIHTQYQTNSEDSVHFVTYSDSMLNNPPNKPKSRASVQNYFLPPQPIQRGKQNQLPPQPISRKKSTECQLPEQPVRRGSSAFHIVDRNSKSRSPSIPNDRIPDKIDSTPKRKKRKDYADVAIRENFSMNAKPFILKESIDVENGPGTRNQNVNQTPQKGYFNARNEKYIPAENLPPYSGPPSYKEHVSSSCNTSVTSSLSSNPDDVYSLPKRRVVTEQENTVRVNGSKSGQYVPGASIYENADLSGGSNPLQHQVRGQVPEAIYSSPAKSKVKQFIVPEDYYAPVNKVTRDVAYTKQGEEKDGIREEVYGNVFRVQENGPSHVYNSSVDGQIAPDAKYHDYEDVYDTPENVQPNEFPTNEFPKHGSDVGNTSHSVNTDRIRYEKAVPKYKSKSRSPKKNKSPYPVSNVHVNTPHLNFVHNADINQNKQISDSVENVHAENVSKIPQIKLNGGEVESAYNSDDDVFLKEDPMIGQRYKSNEKSKVGGHVYSKMENKTSENAVDKQNQNHQEISDFDSSNENQEIGHMITDFSNENQEIGHMITNFSNENQEIGHMITDFSNEQTETGYMKMSLPGKNKCLPNFSKVTPISSNQNGPSSHVTETTRQVPDGIENASSEENEEFEETGV